MKYTIDKANLYIAKNRKNVNNTFRPLYHAAPPIGWMNDPNGVIYYKGQYHVFYQFYPYKAKWGPMHWGHFVSDDLLTFKDMPVALAPDKGEDGCFSGGAIINQNDELVLLYTEHYERDIKHEQQNMAVSSDGITFAKNEQAFLTGEHLPPHACKTDFRDPRAILRDGVYYILVGSKTNDDVGQFLVYKSDDLINFTYHFTIGPDIRFGIMAECPDLFRIDGVDVLIMSGIKVAPRGKEFVKANSSIAFIGQIDFTAKTYRFDHYHEIDLGHDFYAPQTLVAPSGERVMTAWLNMWDKEYFTAKNGHGWVGQLTLPRVLSVRNNRLFQQPLSTINNYHQTKTQLLTDLLINKWSHLKLNVYTVNDGEIRFSNPENANDYFTISFENRFISLDTSTTINYPQSKKTTTKQYDNIKLEVFLDSSSIELFINDGEEVITTSVFIDAKQYRVELSEAYVSGEVYTLFREGK